MILKFPVNEGLTNGKFFSFLKKLKKYNFNCLLHNEKFERSEPDFC